MVHATAGHELHTFMDAYYDCTGYIYIPMTKKRLILWLTKKYIAMKLCHLILKVVASTYQQHVNNTFQEHVEDAMKVYIDDMLIKSKNATDDIETFISHSDGKNVANGKQ